MKTLIVSLTSILLCLFYPCHIICQQIQNEVIAANGGYFSNSDFSISFTTGDLAISTLESSNYYLLQGFQHPIDILTKVMQHKRIDGMHIYPNPVTDFLTINIGEENLQLYLKVIDLEGRTHIIRKLVNIDNSIDMRTFAPGCYLVRLENNTGQVLHSKIILKR